MAKFGSLAAGALAAGTALASANEAAAQATEWVVPLESGGEIAMDVEGVSSDTQQRVFAELQACVGAAELTRDECVGAAAVLMASERLDHVVRQTHQQLKPLEDEVGMSVAELIQAPEYCDFAATDEGYEACLAGTDKVEIASLDLQIAAAEANRIASLTLLDQVTREADEAEQVAEEAQIRADAAQAVLAVLSRIADEEQQKSTIVPAEPEISS